MAPLFSLLSLAGIHKRTFVLLSFTRCNTLVISRWFSWFFKQVSLHLYVAWFKVTFLVDSRLLLAPKTLGIHRKLLEIICIQPFLINILSFGPKNYCSFPNYQHLVFKCQLPHQSCNNHFCMLLPKAFASLLCIDPNTSALPIFLLVPCSPARTTQAACWPYGLCQPCPKPLIALHTSTETSAFCFSHPGLSPHHPIPYVARPLQPFSPRALQAGSSFFPTYTKLYNLPLSIFSAVPKSETLPIAPVPLCRYLRSM